MLLESDILRLFFTGPYLVSSPLCSVSGVDCPSVVSSRNSLSAGLLPPTPPWSPVQLPTLSWVASSTLVRVPLPLPDTARFQVQESFVWFRAKTDSSALAAYPHSATCVIKKQVIITLRNACKYYPLCSTVRKYFQDRLQNQLVLKIASELVIEKFTR